jgi:dehydratase
MSTTRSALVRAAAITPIVLTTTFCLAGTASAATYTVNWTCQATVGGIAQTSSMSTTVSGAGPATAAPGSAVAITLTPGTLTVPSVVSGFPLDGISNIVMTIAAPTNSTLVSASGFGGSVGGNVGASNGVVTLTVPGPIAGGTTYTPPAESINVTAGSAGKAIQTRYAGTSYSRPGMTLTINLQGPVGPVSIPTVCYASPNPTLTSTTIS